METNVKYVGMKEIINEIRSPNVAPLIVVELKLLNWNLNGKRYSCMIGYCLHYPFIHSTIDVVQLILQNLHWLNEQLNQNVARERSKNTKFTRHSRSQL